MARRCEKWGFLLWIFAKGREIGGVYWSVIGHRLRVGAMGGEGQGAGVVQIGVDGGGNVGKGGL